MLLKDKKIWRYLLKKYKKEYIFEYISYLDCLYYNKDRIIKNKLNENVNIGPIADAIKNRWVVKIKYKSEEDDKIGTEERVIQPVAYGVSKSNNLVLRAYQPQGDTKTKVPHWKLFRLDKIIEWKPLRNEIMYSPPKENYNPKGDKTMKVCYRNADFTRRKYTNTNLSNINRSRRSEKPIENNKLILSINKKK